MNVFLDNVSLFVSINSDISTDGSGMTPLLAYCEGGEFCVEGLSSLINRGADVSARSKDGRTCLHHALACSWFWERGSGSRAVTARAALEYLVSHGADPFAVDVYRLSVSQSAYFQGPTWLSEEDDTRKADVWDAVLAGIGVDVAQNRRQYYLERGRDFDMFYTRQGFETVWPGKEHLCSYYDEEHHGDTVEASKGIDFDGEAESDFDGDFSEGWDGVLCFINESSAQCNNTSKTKGRQSR